MQIPQRRRTPQEEQYVCLGRLAWSLREAGVAASVSLVLRRRDEPFVLISRVSTSEKLRVRATLREGQWVFTWGRGPGQCADTSDTGIQQLWKAAQ